MDFEQVTSKELRAAKISEKYARNREVEEKLLSFENGFQRHLDEKEARQDDYSRKLEALYTPIIQEQERQIKGKEKEISDREKMVESAKEALKNGDQTQERTIASNLAEIEKRRADIVATRQLIEKYDAKRKNTSDFVEQERKYTSFTDVIGKLYESQLTHRTSEYYNNAVNNAMQFIQNLNTNITDDVTLFEQIKNYCQVREHVDKYLTKRTSIFGSFTTKGETRLALMTSLRDLLDEHEDFLISRYESILETGHAHYIDAEDHFQMPGKLSDLNRTMFAKRMSCLPIHKEFQEHMSSYKPITQEFLDDNCSKKGFVMNQGDKRFSQAFTILRYNADGTYTEENDKEIADTYVQCFSKNAEERKQALENLVIRACNTIIQNTKAVFADLNVVVNQDKVTVPKMTKERYLANYKKMYMLTQFNVNRSSLFDIVKGIGFSGHDKEWGEFAKTVFNEKELAPYWKEAEYYVQAAQMAFQIDFEMQSSAVFTSSNFLTPIKNDRIKSAEEREFTATLYQQDLTQAYTELQDLNEALQKSDESKTEQKDHQ